MSTERPQDAVRLGYWLADMSRADYSKVVVFHEGGDHLWACECVMDEKIAFGAYGHKSATNAITDCWLKFMDEHIHTMANGDASVYAGLCGEVEEARAALEQYEKVKL